MEAFSRVGTPLYMSPEVLQGSGYDFKSDVWSLGCITYEMCALKSPFKDESKKMSLYDLFTKINSGVYQPLSASRYSSELRYMIDSMLRVDPSERVDITDVVAYCEKHIAQLMIQSNANNQSQQEGHSSNSKEAKRISRMDPVLIMDDIIEKLHLLDYLKKFCPKYNRRPISRTFFAIKCESEPTELKVRYFVELSYWLMSLSIEGAVEESNQNLRIPQTESAVKKDRTNSAKKNQPKSRVGSSSGKKNAKDPQDFTVNYDKFKSKEEAIEKLLADVKRFKVALPDNFQPKLLYEGFGEGVCYIVNDLTNRELIRKNFKFEMFKMNNNSTSDPTQNNMVDEDIIVEGSTIFANTQMLEGPTQQSRTNPMGGGGAGVKGKTVGSKDMTNEANVYKTRKGQFFQQLNQEPLEDDLHHQFQSLLAQTPFDEVQGRSDPLFRGHNSNAHTGSTATSSEPPITSRSFHPFTGVGGAAQNVSQFSTTKYKRGLNLEEIVQEKEILESSIDPKEWQKECERVKDQLNFKINPMMHAGQNRFETEAEEINNRRQKMMDHIKVVREFSQSNIPLLMESLCSYWNNQLVQIRKQESKITSQNSELVDQLRGVQSTRLQLMNDLRDYAAKIDTKLQIQEGTDRDLEQVNEKIEALTQSRDQNSQESSLKLLKSRISDLKHQVSTSMHQKEGILRTQLERMSINAYREGLKEQRREATLQLRHRKGQTSIKINAQNREDREIDELIEKKKANSSGKKKKKDGVSVEDKDGYSSCSWDSDFD